MEKSTDNPMAGLAREMLALEAETFEIHDYNGANGRQLGDNCSCSTTSSTTSCSSTG
jgi:thiazolylpeptide-type bacteriocin precursor